MDLCRHCFMQFELNLSRCICCAQPFEESILDGALCGRCQQKQPEFDQIYAPFLYAGNLRYLITALKFNAQYKNARLLAQLMTTQLNDSIALPESFIPVPLHPKRYRQRGFNQAIEIADRLSTLLAIPSISNACVRVRDTPHQIGQPAKHRQKNLKKAFEVVKPFNAKHIAIIDDVMTTGSTANELAASLKKRGVSRVDVWVCGRA